MVNISKLFSLIIFLFVGIAMMYGCSDNSINKISAYSSPPTFDKSIILEVNGDTLQPSSMKLFNDTIFVSYYNQAKIDLYDLEFNKLKSISLTDPEKVFPTSIAVSDTAIYVSIHSKHLVVIYDREGNYQTSFGTLPDGKTELSPFDMEYFGGVLYVADIILGKILAISVTKFDVVTEIGELILTIPPDSTPPLGIPSALKITHDGRLFAGDSKNGDIGVFTCMGDRIYSFESVEFTENISPQGFAIDRMKDPAMQDSTSFDPSGIRLMGRVHVLDSNNKTVHMFNPVGEYISSYPENSELQKPTDILITNKLKKVYIADPKAKRIFAYRIGS